VNDFECGFITLDDYLDKTIFYEKRNFSGNDFKNFMEEQSIPLGNNLSILEEIANEKHYHIFALNNEFLELNNFRIKKFNLKNYFSSFFSSCYLGTRKPEKKIFEIALKVTQNEPQNCLFIDDREENINTALALGFNTIHYSNEKDLNDLLKINRIK
jgi:putative hydrolase of the HAD superfamily